MIKKMFGEYAAISCMEMNLLKTVVATLWPQPLREIKDHIARVLP